MTTYTMEQPSENIETLIRESVSGNTESYRKLYEHLVRRVFAYVCSRTSGAEAATDITQDVFIDLWTALPTFTYHSREAFYAFVFVITKRKLALHYSSESRHKTDELTEKVLETHETHGGRNEEEEDAIARALKTLDERSREIIVLHHWSGYTFGEIAHLTKMTETAVRVRHHRALKTLRINLLHTP